MSRPKVERLKLPRYVRQVLVAEWMGVTRQTLAELVRDPACPRRRTDDGEWEYPWPEINVYFHGRAIERASAKAVERKKNAKEEDQTVGRQLDQAKLERAIAEAKQAQLDLAKRQGELVPLEEHLRLVREVLDRVRTGLLALPGQLAPIMLGLETVADAQVIVVQHVDELLEGLRRRE